MRKLASIQRITDIQPIPGADNIVVATVQGWKVVIKKGEFNVGDFVVYIEIDSILPKRPEFEFMSKHHYRVRTVRLRGQISQGLCMSVSILPSDKHYTEGEDVTDLLGIRKHEPVVDVALRSNAVGKRPWFVPRTDEIRVENIPEVFQIYQDIDFVVTEKLDGTSISCFYYKGEFGVCSRELQLSDDNNVYWNTIRKYDLPNKLPKYCEDVERSLVLQGELVGPKIQGNPLGLTEHRIYFFNVYVIEDAGYLNWSDFKSVMDGANLDCPIVPALDENVRLKDHNIYSLQKMYCKRSQLGDTLSEGVVFRVQKNIVTTFIVSNKFSFKVINPEYLLQRNA